MGNEKEEEADIESQIRLYLEGKLFDQEKAQDIEKLIATNAKWEDVYYTLVDDDPDLVMAFYRRKHDDEKLKEALQTAVRVEKIKGKLSKTMDALEQQWAEEEQPEQNTALPSPKPPDEPT